MRSQVTENERWLLLLVSMWGWSSWGTEHLERVWGPGGVRETGHTGIRIGWQTMKNSTNALIFSLRYIPSPDASRSSELPMGNPVWPQRPLAASRGPPSPG